MLRGNSDTAPVGTPSASSGTSLRSGSLDAVAGACKSDRRYGCPSSGASSDGHGMLMNAIRAASSDCCSERGGDALPEPTWAKIFGMSFCSLSQCSQARATMVSG